MNNDERRSYGSNFPSTSTTASTSHQSRRNPRISNNHHKRFSLNENSIDADNMDVSFAFPHDFDKYSDDIWRKTVSSDCDQSIQVWEKQPEAMASWGASSRFYEPSSARSARLFDDDHDIFSTGGNYFFPTSGASTSSSARRLTTADSKPSSNRRKQNGSKIPSMSTALDSDDEFQTIKKRLSLSSLRNSLCRQKALENLNNENQGAGSSSNNPQPSSTSVISGSNDDFLQVFIIFSLLFEKITFLS